MKRQAARATRGQLYTSDALLSLVVFAFALALIAGLNAQLLTQADATNQTYIRDAAASRLLHTLLSSPGTPSDWEILSDRNAVSSVGLVNHHAGISVEKWNAFLDWNGDDYPSLTQHMGISDYNFYLSITDINRSVLSAAGIAPVDVNNVSVVVFPSLYNQHPVTVQVQVYRT